MCTNKVRSKNRFEYRKAQVVAEVAILTSLSVILSRIPIFHMPQGGSITLASMVPIILLSLRRGPKVGIATGVLYGIIRLMLGANAIDPFQVILEYPIAFAVLGLAAFFPDRPILGSTIAIVCRFLIHFAVGAIWWAPAYVPNLNPIIYSASYNSSYLLPELVISGVLLYLLHKSKVIKAYL
jgi:thiamine transporter